MPKCNICFSGKKRIERDFDGFTGFPKEVLIRCIAFPSKNIVMLPIL